MKIVNSILYFIALIVLFLAIIYPTYGVLDFAENVTDVYLFDTFCNTSSTMLALIFLLFGAPLLGIFLNNKAAKVTFASLSLVVLIFIVIELIDKAKLFSSKDIYSLYAGYFFYWVGLAFILVIDVLVFISALVKKNK